MQVRQERTVFIQWLDMNFLNKENKAFIVVVDHRRWNVVVAA